MVELLQSKLFDEAYAFLKKRIIKDFKKGRLKKGIDAFYLDFKGWQ